MKKFLARILGIVAGLTACASVAGCKDKEEILIYTSTEDYVIEYMQKKLDEKLPDNNIKIEYMSTSNIAAKVLAEGTSSDCDIIFAQEYGYVEKMAAAGVLAKLSEIYDQSVFTEESLLTEAKEYVLPAIKTGGAVILNTKVLTDKGLAKPTSYADLLKPEYKGLVSMPSPKSSGTGYMFYLSLVNAWGEEAALEYFDDLTPNILAYTTSGSGPVNALTSREAAVGMGMISQAAEKLSEGVSELEIVVFDEGAPFNLYGNCVVKGKEEKAGVKAVMDYLYSEFTDLCNAKYYPETVLKDKTYEVANFPQNIKYADMKNNTLANKEGLLEKWTH